MSKRSYEGAEITVHFDSRRCIHAAECVRSLRQVFDPRARPWIEPDAAPAEEVARVIERCPTGALSYEGRDSSNCPTPAELTVVADGPVYVYGDVSIRTEDDKTIEEARLALCRCGASTNKPYCDNSHADIRFVDAGEVNRESGEAETLEGELVISAMANGPLLLHGPFVLVSADGSQEFRGEKGALCRCGESSNKPFCDGTHNRIEFKSS